MESRGTKRRRVHLAPSPGRGYCSPFQHTSSDYFVWDADLSYRLVGTRSSATSTTLRACGKSPGGVARGASITSSGSGCPVWHILRSPKLVRNFLLGFVWWMLWSQSWYVYTHSRLGTPKGGIVKGVLQGVTTPTLFMLTPWEVHRQNTTDTNDDEGVGATKQRGRLDLRRG